MFTVGLEEERRLAEEKAKRDEEARLDQLSEDEYEALSEEIKAQIDARRLKVKKEKIRQLVEKVLSSYSRPVDYYAVYLGEEKNSRNCYNKSKPWRKLEKKRKEETSRISECYDDMSSVT